MNELTNPERCVNCQKPLQEHHTSLLRTQLAAILCPRVGMFTYKQMTPLELSVWIEENYDRLHTA